MNNKLLFCMAAAAALLCPKLAADTEWIVTPRYSGSGRMMLHANRDIATGRVNPVWISWDPAGKGRYGFLRIGNQGGACFAGINEKGLAAAYTTGDPSDDRFPAKNAANWHGHAAVVILLRTSATAEQARTRLHKAFRDKLISQSLVVFLADPRKALVVECSPQHYASWDIKDSYCVYSHMWKLPGMDDGSIRSTGSAEICALREWGVREGLRRVRKANGDRIPVAGSLAVSRLNAHDLSTAEYEKQRGKSPVRFAPHNKRAQDSYLFELDAEYPEFLSRVYIALGPARHTVYLPVALPALKNPPREILEPDYFQLAATRHHAAAPDAPVSAELLEFEKKLHREFEERSDEARALLLVGKTAEAEQLFADLARKQAAETSAFIRDLK